MKRGILKARDCINYRLGPEGLGGKGGGRVGAPPLLWGDY